MSDPIRTFDSSSGEIGGYAPAVQGQPEPQQYAEPVVPVAAPSALDLVRQAAQATIPEAETVCIDTFEDKFRLWVSSDISSKEMQQWQRRSLPPALRKGQFSMLDLDQYEVSATIFERKTQRVEVQHPTSGGYVLVEDQDGNPLTFRDDALLAAFGAMDVRTALKKLFPRDAELVRKGQMVLTVAGWGEVDGDADEENPTS